MKAYKFRTVENLHFVLDILIKRRLHCCLVERLNDAREANTQMGLAPGREGELICFSHETYKEVNGLRICALSKTFDNHLLWAHYAGGYTGVAIEVELEESEITEITYDDKYILWSDLIQYSPSKAARKLLSTKFMDWRYEDEVRIISNSEYHELAHPITRIIVGSKTSPVVIGALCLICANFNIDVERIAITPDGIVAQRIDTKVFTSSLIAK